MPSQPENFESTATPQMDDAASASSDTSEATSEALLAAASGLAIVLAPRAGATIAANPWLPQLIVAGAEALDGGSLSRQTEAETESPEAPLAVAGLAGSLGQRSGAAANDLALGLPKGAADANGGALQRAEDAQQRPRMKPPTCNPQMKPPLSGEFNALHYQTFGDVVSLLDGQFDEEAPGKGLADTLRGVELSGGPEALVQRYETMEKLLADLKQATNEYPYDLELTLGADGERKLTLLNTETGQSDEISWQMPESHLQELRSGWQRPRSNPSASMPGGQSRPLSNPSGSMPGGQSRPLSNPSGSLPGGQMPAPYPGGQTHGGQMPAPHPGGQTPGGQTPANPSGFTPGTTRPLPPPPQRVP